MDIIAKVDQFGRVFDIEDFKKHKAEAYFEILKTKDGDAKEDNAVFAKDIYRMAKEKDIIPKQSIVLYKEYLKNLRIDGFKKKIKSLLKRY